MNSISIDLPGSEVSYIRQIDDSVIIHFSHAIIIKSMTGSLERTRWWQSGDLVLKRAVIHTEVPEGPLVCVRGDIVDNVFTYRDMIPLPFESNGLIGCHLYFQGLNQPIEINATHVRMQMSGVPKYIEHIRVD